MSRLKWIWHHAEGYHGSMIIGYILACIFPAMSLINPRILNIVIDRCVYGGETGILVTLVVIMCAVTLTRTGIGYLMIVFTERSSQGLLYNLRTGLYRQLQEKDMSFYDQFRTGDLMTALTSDLDMIRYNVSYVFRQLITNVVLFVATVFYFLSTNVIYTVCLLLVTPFLFVILRKYSKKARPLYVELRERLSRLSTNAQENIEGNKVVKAFAREDYEISKFAEKSNDFREQNITAVNAWLKVFPYVEGLAQSMTVTSLLVGGLLMIAGQMTPGQFGAVNALIWAISDPIRTSGNLLNDLQRFFASADRIVAIQLYRPRIQTPEDGFHPEKRSEGSVEFKDVSFRFGKDVVLDHVSFSIGKGETVAIMGETGSGKTTIANLISRFYDVTDGQVLMDGVDVRKWDLQALRGSIGMANQDVFLFSDTIDGNIAYGNPDMSEEKVFQYAHCAAADFINRMPEGYDTIIGERGVGLSGGQKQRIALARALALEPPLLILDDTTSAVDMETEKFIQEQLDHLSFSCTKLIIAQRISSVKKADKIVVLKDHKIAEMGTHKELIEKRGIYYDIFRIQQGMAEEVGG